MQTTTCMGAVFHGPGRPLTLESFATPERAAPRSALCRVLMSTICGSDLHTVSGRREEPVPLILGHEVIGEIIDLGEGMASDGYGNPLAIGDRVSWTIMASCGQCRFCIGDLPQKCVHLRKYGHVRCDSPPCLTGGFAEIIQLFPGTVLFKVPSRLSDAVVTPANCALATVVNAVEAAGPLSGCHVLVQGAGMLGLNLMALARESGAASIIAADVRAERLELAREFGADCCVDVSNHGPKDLSRYTSQATGGQGVDIAFEVCGHAHAVPQGLDTLRIGGVYVLAGTVSAGSCFKIDGNTVARRYLTMRGIHNYRPRHLGAALSFLQRYAGHYPFEKLVGSVYPLRRINDAFAHAAQGTAVRIAIKP